MVFYVRVHDLAKNSRAQRSTKKRVEVLHIHFDTTAQYTVANGAYMLLAY
jgi:hypothetical protein